VREGLWGIDYDSSHCRDVLFDIDRFKHVVDFAFEFAAKINVYLAKARREYVAILERQLQYDLGRCYPTLRIRGTASQPKARLNIIHANAKWAASNVQHRLTKEFCSATFEDRVT
jgi:hypothetical protein